MNNSFYRCKRTKSEQLGVAAVEMALVAIPFFLMLLGAIEFGRLMYVWNTVQEVTRNAARQAVVTDFSTSNSAAINAIKYSAVFQTTAGPLPAAGEITNANIMIRYFNAVGGLVTISGSMNPVTNQAECLNNTSACISYVEACVVRTTSVNNANATCASSTELSFAPMIGFFSNLSVLTIPRSTVRMPAESLGFTP